jgi:hypothetical protein
MEALKRSLAEPGRYEAPCRPPRVASGDRATARVTLNRRGR